MTATSQTLREAAEYLRKYGWKRNDALITDGKASNTILAIYRVASGQVRDADKALKALAEYLIDGAFGVGTVEDDIIDVWNDSPNQTAENVILTLEKCAEELEK